MAAPVRNYEKCGSPSIRVQVCQRVRFPVPKESVMTAIPVEHVSKTTPGLHLAFELGWGQWKLAFTIGHGQRPRLRTVAARDLPALVPKAKRRFGLPED